MTCREAVCLLMNFYIVWNFHTRGTQKLLSVKFFGRSKYWLEISKTWERLACSHILYFCSFKSVRMKIENVAIYWPQANIENFSFLFCFLLAYLRFSDVEFFKFIAKIKRLLLKMVSLKFLYMKNVHKNPIMKVWTNIVFSAAPNLPNRLSFTT